MLAGPLLVGARSLQGEPQLHGDHGLRDGAFAVHQLASQRTVLRQLCAPNDRIQKCETNDLCDLASPTPGACKCNPMPDGGLEVEVSSGASLAGEESLVEALLPQL